MFCIGHRGAAGHAPENTVASVLKAVQLGAHAVEVDVYAVQGQLFVFHDDRLERTTNGSGRVTEQGFEYLRSLDAGQGERIPTLEEVFAALDQRACINIELKGSGTALPVAKALREARAKGWKSEALLVSSFHHGELERLRALDANVGIGILLNTTGTSWFHASRRLKAYSVHLPMRLMGRSTVREVHSHGLRIFAFTANTLEEIGRMRDLKVDGIFSDYPERVEEACGVTKSNIGWP